MRSEGNPWRYNYKKYNLQTLKALRHQFPFWEKFQVEWDIALAFWNMQSAQRCPNISPACPVYQCGLACTHLKISFSRRGLSLSKCYSERSLT